MTKLSSVVILKMLAQYGHNDVVWQMACQTAHPS